MKKPTHRAVNLDKVGAGVRALNKHLFPDPLQPLASERLARETKPVGKRRKVMNKTEAQFARILEARQRRGEIDAFEYESVTLRWGDLDNIKYTADFVTEKRSIDETDASNPYPFIQHVFIEVKNAHIWPKDMQKFKAARNEWPQYRFELWQLKAGEWTQLL